jgi:plasmid stabilization system protein ParE
MGKVRVNWTQEAESWLLRFTTHRILLYGHYRIAYLIKSADEIDVLGVFHGALDIDRYLT